MTELRAGPIDPENEEHKAELIRQREECGWNADQVPEYMNHIKQGDLLYFFFYNESGQIIGSGAIDLECGLFEKDMSSKKDKKFSLVGLFIWNQYVFKMQC